MNKNGFTFWLIFGLDPNLGLSDSLSGRLSQIPVLLYSRRQYIE